MRRKNSQIIIPHFFCTRVIYRENDKKKKKKKILCKSQKMILHSHLNSRPFTAEIAFFPLRGVLLRYLHFIHVSIGQCFLCCWFYLPILLINICWILQKRDFSSDRTLADDNTNIKILWIRASVLWRKIFSIHFLLLQCIFCVYSHGRVTIRVEKIY